MFVVQRDGMIWYDDVSSRRVEQWRPMPDRSLQRGGAPIGQQKYSAKISYYILLALYYETQSHETAMDNVVLLTHNGLILPYYILHVIAVYLRSLTIQTAAHPF